MISSVYSYYLSQYGHRTNSKYDTHTKSQLKNTYSKVVKITARLLYTSLTYQVLRRSMPLI